jgi:acyl carrier protein
VGAITDDHPAAFLPVAASMPVGHPRPRCALLGEGYLTRGGNAMVPTQSAQQRVERLVSEYAQRVPPGSLDPRLSLRDDLGVESLSLVSLVVRLGDDLGADVTEAGLELAGIDTVGDLVALAQRLAGEPA